MSRCAMDSGKFGGDPRQVTGSDKPCPLLAWPYVAECDGPKDA
jgi:hypothetical protein